MFYVNLPFGIIALTGLLLFMPNTKPRVGLKFSWAGFAMLALALGALQLMLDRGQEQDWFSAREIIIEAVLAGLGFYLFIVHMFTAEKPFLPPALFRDRNFVASFIMIFCVSMVMLATSALLAPYCRIWRAIPSTPRGCRCRRAASARWRRCSSRPGSKWVDQRKIMAVGLVILGWALHAMSAWTPDVTEGQMIVTLIIQGFSIGLVFNPLAVIAFSTLSSGLRGDGTALQALARNIGSAIGISVTSFTLERSAQAMHADIAAGITPFNRLLQHGGAVARCYDPLVARGAALLNQEITRQSEIIAYNNDFHMMAFVVVPPLLLIC